MKIAIGGDHAGFDYKKIVGEALESQGCEIKDVGPFSCDSVDYPDFAHPLAESVSNGEVDFGILICGSGNGVAMSANKHKNVRAALCWNKEVTELSRQHNNANVLCMPARFISSEEAVEFAKTFVSTEFEGGRHDRRVNKISC